MARFLLLGKDGQLGSELLSRLQALGEVTAWGRADADLSRPDALLERVIAIKPTHIINAAAYTAVDKAEDDQATAMAVNSQAVAALANAAKALGAWVVHYSTDYVFDGSGAKSWLETDATNPVNFYGQSKLAGEQALIASGALYMVFRTSWVYGLQGGNFAKTMLRLACERDELKVVSDQIGVPTSAAWLADVTLLALKNPVLGIYHAAPAGETSWHGYASYLIAKAHELGLAGLRASKANIHEVSSDAFPTRAKRPNNSRLDCAKLEDKFGILRPDWTIGVNQFLNAYLHKHDN